MWSIACATVRETHFSLKVREKSTLDNLQKSPYRALKYRIIRKLEFWKQVCKYVHENSYKLRMLWAYLVIIFKPMPKLYIPSTLKHLIVCAENAKSWFKSWFFPFNFQAYILLHTLNFMCVSLFKFHVWILEQF